jgi:hypothetical protein
MAQFQRPNPYQPSYATPNYVYGEPPGRGTLTTKGLPRGTIDTADAHQTQANFAVPGYVLSETQGRGAYGTKMLPRRFVDTLAPDDLARPFPNRQGSLSGTVFSKKTLTGSSLGDVTAYGDRQRDPFKLYGAQAVEWIEKHILQNHRLDLAQKREALRKVLDRIDPSLRLVIGRKAEAFRLQGDLPGVAYRKAMAEALAAGLMDEVQGLGRKGLSGTPRMFGRRLRGGGALGATSTSAPQKIKINVGGAQFDVTRYADGTMEGTKKYTSPGGFQGLRLPGAVDRAFRAAQNRMAKLGANLRSAFGAPVDIMVKQVANGKFPVIKFGSPVHGVYVALDTGAFNDAIKSATITIKRVPPPDKNWLEKGIDAFTSVVTLPFKIAGKVVEAGVDLVEDAVDKLGGLACKVVSSELGTIAAGTAGGAYGGPAGAQAGMMGAQIGAGICGGGGGGPPMPYVEEKPFPILPVALAAGGVLLVFLAVKE